MKEKINQVNQLIDEKCDRLKDKAERSFTFINTILNNTTKNSEVVGKGRNIPPISYILYGMAGISSIGALASDSKLLCLGVAAASAFGGYKFSKQKEMASPSATRYQNPNLDSLKNEVSAKVLDIVKKITNEWEDFMELQQKVVQNAIAASSLSDSDKESLQSKVFIYEVIDISISDFSSMINSVSEQSDMKTQIDLYKSKLLSAIDSAADKQINKYNSII